MTVTELGKILKVMYSTAPDGEAVAMIHLFGIKYSQQIEESGISSKDIAIAADINVSYGTEIRKGVKLSKYVILKE